LNVPFLDLRAAYLELRDEIDAAVRGVLDSGWHVLGAQVRPKTCTPPPLACAQKV